MTVGSNSGRPLGLGGRIIGTLFFGAFLAAGLVFSGLVLRETWEIAQTYTWPKTECVILDSQAGEQSQDQASPYSFTVTYQYFWNGREYTSHQVSRKPPSFSEFSKAQRLAQKYKPDSKAFCFVNPKSPDEAILQRRSLWFGLTFFFTLIFVAIGGGGIYAMWHRSGQEGEAAATPLTSKASSGRARVFLLFFFLVFLLAGLTMAWIMGIKPILRIMAAKSWRETPCTIVSSRVQSHDSDDSTTYSIDILYAYEFNGQDYKSSRYHFFTGSSSGYDGKAAVVKRYPPGMRTSCYVNPNDPVEAVLYRGFNSQMWWGLFSLPFLGVGLGGVGYYLRKWRGEREGSAAGKRVTGTSSYRPQVIKPGVRRLLGFLGAVAMAGFWNGILSIFLGQVIQGFRHHRPEWFLVIFLIPFVLVGLVLLGLIVYQFLALFNPQVQLTATPPDLALGDTLDVHWRVRGRSSRIQKLRIYLEGREEVTYRQGNSTATCKHVFATYELAAAEPPGNVESGWNQLKIPLETMHSFATEHNKITWAIQMRGEISHWPDIKDECPVEIGPAPAKHFQPL